MRGRLIFDSEDHISEEAVSVSATSLVPSGSLLVVTRSGILRHTLPVAMAAREVAINQDLKALLPHDAIHPPFIHQLVQWLAPNSFDNVPR